MWFLDFTGLGGLQGDSDAFQEIRIWGLGLSV